MMTKEEIQKKLLYFNRKGAMMRCRQTPDGPRWTAMLDGSLTVVRVEGDAWWLSWRDAWFINGSTPGHLIKVVKTTVVELAEDEHDGELWFEIVLIDDFGAEFQIEGIIPEYDLADYQAWKAWDDYRNKNAEKMKGIDKMIIDAHTRHAEEWRH